MEKLKIKSESTIDEVKNNPFKIIQIHKKIREISKDKYLMYHNLNVIKDSYEILFHTHFFYY